MLASRLKERGGGGGKVMAPPRTAPEPTPTLDKRSASAPRRTPISGKENHVTVTSRKSSVPRQRPLAAPDPSNKKPLLVPASGVRWSTSSLPRSGTDSTTPRLGAASIGLLRQSSLRASATGTTDKSRGSGLPEVRRSSSGVGGLDDSRQRRTGVQRDRERDGSSVSLRNNNHGRKDPNATKSEVDEKRRRPSLGSCTKSGTGGGAAASAQGIQHTKGRMSVSNRGPVVSLDIPLVAKVAAVSINTTGEDFHSNLAGGVASTASAISRILKVAGGENADLQTDSEFGKKKVPLAACSNSAASCEVLDSSDATSGSSQGKECSVFEAKPDKPASVVTKTGSERYRKSTGNTAVTTTRQTNGDVKPKVEVQGPCKSSNANHADPGRVLKAVTVFESANATTDQKKVDPVASRYPSKLHEKLAMLEGKVQRIATDIKRTKDMLDSSNPDASKLVLSDIQRRISGIEKAVGSMIDGAKTKAPIPLTVDKDAVGQNKSERVQGCQVKNENHSVKPLISEQQEGRLSTYQNLPKNDKASDDLEVVGQNKPGKSVTVRSESEQHFEDGPMNLIDEDPVALEFLASLDEADSTKGLPAITSTKAETENTLVVFSSKGMVSLPDYSDNAVVADRKEGEFEEQENRQILLPMEEFDDFEESRVFNIGSQTSTGGWFVSDGEAVLLANSDGSCTYFDVTNNEKKADYKPPPGLANNLWGDCWFLRAPGADGCAGRYIVAASAGNTSESGFCSWDFYKKDIHGFRLEVSPNPSPSTKCQWWYRPCGYLIASASTNQNILKAYDIRDGNLVLDWSVHSPVTSIKYSSPLQWRSKGKVMIAETEAISLWDVNSLNPQPLLSVACVGKKISALHVNNTDAELGGGIRQRVSSSEVDGNDGVFCTEDSFSVFDFRLPSGVGLKVSNPGYNIHSAYSRGDLVLIGGTETRSELSGGPKSVIQSFSMRKGKTVATYTLPVPKAYTHQSAVVQVWGNSRLVMGACGMGLFVFDVPKEGGRQISKLDQGERVVARESFGSDLCLPSFDYLGERVLLISRDRPASCRYLL